LLHFQDAHVLSTFAQLFSDHPALKETIDAVTAANPLPPDHVLLFAVLECHLSRYEKNAPSTIVVPMVVKVEKDYDQHTYHRHMSMNEFVCAMNISC
jgi:hypothetical protein